MERYKTKDLAEASYLLAKGKKLSAMEREGKVCWFSFENKFDCEALVNDFWFDNNSFIHAKSFYEAIQTLKKRIFINI